MNIIPLLKIEVKSFDKLRTNKIRLNSIFINNTFLFVFKKIEAIKNILPPELKLNPNTKKINEDFLSLIGIMTKNT